MALKSFVLTIAILVVLTSISHASSNTGLPQDFTNDSRAAVFVNEKACKDPKYVTAEDFFRPGLNMPRNTSNTFGFAVTTANVYSVALARIDYAPYGLNPFHTNHRGSEILTVVEGTLYVGFVTSNSGQNMRNKLFTKILYPGDVFVFPRGLIHFQFNIKKTKAVAFVGFSSEAPGIIYMGNAVFGSHPPIDDDVLAKAFQVDKKIVDYIQSQFRCYNN